MMAGSACCCVLKKVGRRRGVKVGSLLGELIYLSFAAGVASDAARTSLFRSFHKQTGSKTSNSFVYVCGEMLQRTGKTPTIW